MEKDPNLHQITPFLEPNSLDQTRVILEETRLVATWLYQKPTNTRIAYESDIKKFFSFFKGKTLKEIQTAHIVFFFNQHPDMEASTKARYRSSLSSLYKFLIKQRYLDYSPVVGMDKINVPDKTQFRTLFIEDVKRMIELEENDRNKLLITLLFKLGLRESEAISIRINHLVKRGERYFLTIIGKGSKARTNEIPEGLFNWVMKYKIDGEAEIPLFRQKKSKKGISRHTVQKIIKNAAVRAKLSENVSPHWLRHAHATESLLSGDDLAVIQKTLGHNSIATTVKYTRVFPEQTSGKKLKI